MEVNERWGAWIERGIIDAVDGSRYRIKSICRDGVTTPWLEVLCVNPKLTDAEYKPTEYKTGDMVYFFMFPDGHGAILGKAK